MRRSPALVLSALAGLLLGGPAARPAPAQEGGEKVFRNKLEEVRVTCRNCLFDEAAGRSSGKPAPRPLVPFDEGTPCPICAGSGVLKASVDWTTGFYLTEGIGVPPKDLETRYRDAGAEERVKILAQAESKAKLAARQDAWRNAAAVAAKVRLDGEQRVGDRSQKLTAEIVGMEDLGGEWNTQHARPFFRTQVRIPLWGVKGVVATLLEEGRAAATRARDTRKPFDWRSGGAAPPGGQKPSVPPDAPPPGGGKPPGGPGAEKPPEGPPEAPAPPGNVEKPAEEITGIIIDAREAVKEHGPLNPSLFPAILVDESPEEGGEAPAPPPGGEKPPDAPPAPPGGEAPAPPPGNPADSEYRTVHDVADTDPQAAASRGVVSYVESDAPFERISAIFGAKGWRVCRATLESEPLAADGLLAQVKVAGGGAGKKKLVFKVKAEDLAGTERANIVLSEQDAKALKTTDAATGALKNCKVIVISGGDVAGRRGALPDGDGPRVAKR